MVLGATTERFAPDQSSQNVACRDPRNHSHTQWHDEQCTMCANTCYRFTNSPKRIAPQHYIVSSLQSLSGNEQAIGSEYCVPTEGTFRNSGSMSKIFCRLKAFLPMILSRSTSELVVWMISAVPLMPCTHSASNQNGTQFLRQGHLGMQSPFRHPGGPPYAVLFWDRD